MIINNFKPVTYFFNIYHFLTYFIKYNKKFNNLKCNIKKFVQLYLNMFNVIYFVDILNLYPHVLLNLFLWFQLATMNLL